jgi:hypothetical protein
VILDRIVVTEFCKPHLQKSVTMVTMIVATFVLLSVRLSQLVLAAAVPLVVVQVGEEDHAISVTHQSV